MMCKRIFENILVSTDRKKSCDSRSPLGLARTRGGATPVPHSRPVTNRRKTGADDLLGERGPPGEGGVG